MKKLNSNCIVVALSIMDYDKDLGFTEGRGTNKEEIMEKSRLSLSTVNRSLKLLIEQGLVKEAIKQINKKAYYVTQDGLDKIKEIRDIE
ncbi:TPA: winged helix-turn-helix transcriptional regulator [Clostridium perfringens]|nr:winged helix-turn-helix transcriptional regulator [Clostridium perfringens]